jgi:hypothetical protein
MAKSASATDIFSHGDADEPLLHGGDLSAARRQFPDAPEPFIDLSTGINPNSYPLPTLSPETFTRLPEPESVARLAGRSFAMRQLTAINAESGHQRPIHGGSRHALRNPI